MILNEINMVETPSNLGFIIGTVAGIAAGVGIAFLLC
ncbi:hypothetical protein J2S04_002538 [Alicyclobacillus tengchongensis]|uniref:Class IIb bacteriocin, lactobin A/cerein 7B family n=1 Tax=Alicyclobacillus tolerans TaxID=90970 RepID=A0ABT9LZ67_9BACL|nr:hypothetical protein [Alicyclobacillus tengchongensis]